MKTPFGPPLNIEKLEYYITNNNPSKFQSDAKLWGCDLTDVLTIADIIIDEVKNVRYAVELYRFALREFEKNPSQISEDTNLIGAYIRLSLALGRLEEYDEALTYLHKAKKIDNCEPAVNWGIIEFSYFSGRCFDAYITYDEIDDKALFFKKIKRIVDPNRFNYIETIIDKISNHDSVINSILETTNYSHPNANKLFIEKEFTKAIILYLKCVTCYDQLLKLNLIYSLPQELIGHAITGLINAYHDIGQCQLQISDRNLNKATHSFLNALKYDINFQDSRQNLLYCISAVNFIFQRYDKNVKKGSINEKYVHLHNQGFDIMKTPFPTGTPNRDWESAARCLKLAINIDATQAISHHLLGLAFEQLKKDNDAINEWIKVYEIDPHFNFENCVKIILV